MKGFIFVCFLTIAIALSAVAQPLKTATHNSVALNETTYTMANSWRQMPVYFTFSGPTRGFDFEIKFPIGSIKEAWFGLMYWPAMGEWPYYTSRLDTLTGILRVVLVGGEPIHDTLKAFISVRVADLRDQTLEVAIVKATFSQIHNNILEDVKVNRLISGCLVVLPPVIFGDINNNGDLSITDGVLALDIASGKYTATSMELFRGDVNGDDYNNSGDVYMILSRLAGYITCFPVENCWYGIADVVSTPTWPEPVRITPTIDGAVIQLNQAVTNGDLELELPIGVIAQPVLSEMYSVHLLGNRLKISFVASGEAGLRQPDILSLVGSGAVNTRITGTVNTNVPVYSVVEALTDVPESTTPASFVLTQNYPNPFNPTTRINYALPGAVKVTLKVYDLLGQEVALLVNERQPAGNYEVTFDASNIPTGLYIYRLRAGEFTQTKKMLLTK
ncbi:MAG: T9SS type A sorting domain-containing protein [Patescibacteria group bacterium]